MCFVLCLVAVVAHAALCSFSFAGCAYVGAEVDWRALLQAIGECTAVVCVLGRVCGVKVWDDDETSFPD